MRSIGSDIVCIRPIISVNWHIIVSIFLGMCFMGVGWGWREGDGRARGRLVNAIVTSKKVTYCTSALLFASAFSY